MKLLRELSTTRKIMLFFLFAVLVGSVLLSLPISHAKVVSVSYIDALFTATTAVCVTGLVTLPTYSTWSVFGQIVLLILIQIGGLGIVTVMSGFMIGFHKRIGLGGRMLIQDAFNLNTLSGVVKFTKKVLIGTFIVEGVGALMYMTVFIPQFGPKGIWISIFNSISAFCNAGIDIISDNSLCDYTLNPMINLTSSLLIILSGIGYIVWWDFLKVIKEFPTKKFKCFKNLTFHSKIAITVSLILIFAGGFLFFIFEFNNPDTIGNYGIWGKMMASLFQSITTRTAGFASIPQENLTNASSFISLILMFIGGSPTGTAGGIKTVTAAVLVASAIATIKNKDETSMFHRAIPKASVNKSVAVIAVSFGIMSISTILLCFVTDANILDILYETVSATATVGLTRNFTSTLDIWGKLVIIFTMYLGRVGPISLFIALNSQKQVPNAVKNPTEQISVG
ncbi:MAG: potassium transporter KtrB [Lachnospiraceae bacterium]|nr:potassium transporter KtrB [Lachnospiraceae bacterium]